MSVSTLRTCIAAALMLVFAAGCQTTRRISVFSDPSGATVSVDGMERGVTPLAGAELVFKGGADTRQVTASKRGFKPRTVPLTRDFEGDRLDLKLSPESKRVTITVSPMPAIVSLDGRPLSSEPVETLTQEIEFAVDARGAFRDRVLTADRPGFQRTEIVTGFTDGKTSYAITLEPMRKDVSIETTPSGAEVMLDGRVVGVSPVKLPGVPFQMTAQGEWVPKRVRLSKAGFDPVEMSVGWDDGRSSYSFPLDPKTKTVRFLTTPGDASVRIDGRDIRTDASGVASVQLPFPPVNDAGELRSYTAVVSRKTGDSEWYPVELKVGWDDGRTDYPVQLREILTTPVPLLSVGLERGNQGWAVVPKLTETIAAKATTEAGDRQSPLRIAAVPRGTSIGSLTVSPDGQRIVFSALSGSERGDFKSQLRLVRTDGTGGVSAMTDGQTLDVCPSFAPGGNAVVFSSNRAGRRGGAQLNIWSINADGTGGVKRLMAGGDTNDLWPSQDSDPEARLFYEAWVDGRPDPRIYMTQLGTVFQTDLSQMSGMQPRISPKNDAILFTAVNEQTGKRDVYRMSDKGTGAENLTNTPDVDEADPVWSKDGTRILFTSDRAVDGEGRANYDIWLLDLESPNTPVQLTTNASVDDAPAWDPNGDAVYFRSNRGGDWGIWRIAVPRR